MNGEDRELAALTSELTQEPYLLTVKNFADSMTSLATRLVKNVPRAILVYQSKRIQSDLKELNAMLLNAEAEKQVEIIKSVQEKTMLRKKIDEKLGRVR